MHLDPALKHELIKWGQSKGPIEEVWLFGSYAKGTATDASDVDIAIVLAPADGDHNWALGLYLVKAAEWRAELEAIVSGPISFGAMTPGDEMDQEVRATGIILWQRSYTRPRGAERS